MPALAALERKERQAPGVTVGMAVHTWGSSTLLMVWHLANTALSCFLNRPCDLPTAAMYLMSEQVSFRPFMNGCVPAGRIAAHGNNSTGPDRPVAWTVR